MSNYDVPLGDSIEFTLEDYTEPVSDTIIFNFTNVFKMLTEDSISVSDNTSRLFGRVESDEITLTEEITDIKNTIIRLYKGDKDYNKIELTPNIIQNDFSDDTNIIYSVSKDKITWTNISPGIIKDIGNFNQLFLKIVIYDRAEKDKNIVFDDIRYELSN